MKENNPFNGNDSFRNDGMVKNDFIRLNAIIQLFLFIAMRFSIYSMYAPLKTKKVLKKNCNASETAIRISSFRFIAKSDRRT